MRCISQVQTPEQFATQHGEDHRMRESLQATRSSAALVLGFTVMLLAKARRVAAVVVILAMIPATSGCTLIGLGIGSTVRRPGLEVVESFAGSPDDTRVSTGDRVEVRFTPGEPTGFEWLTGYSRVAGTYVGPRELDSGGEPGETGRVLVVATGHGEHSVRIERVRRFRVRTRNGGSYAWLGALVGAGLDAIAIFAAVAAAKDFGPR